MGLKKDPNQNQDITLNNQQIKRIQAFIYINKLNLTKNNLGNRGFVRTSDFGMLSFQKLWGNV